MSFGYLAHENIIRSMRRVRRARDPGDALSGGAGCPSAQPYRAPAVVCASACRSTCGKPQAQDLAAGDPGQSLHGLSTCHPRASLKRAGSDLTTTQSEGDRKHGNHHARHSGHHRRAIRKLAEALKYGCTAAYPFHPLGVRGARHNPLAVNRHRTLTPYRHAILMTPAAVWPA